MECTIGFEIKEEYGDDEKYYVGLVPDGADEVNPETAPNIISMDDIGD